jgi:hypothetical protein
MPAATSRSRKGSKEVAKGLVPERKLDGMIVAFATRPGETAEDNLASGFARSMITYHFINGTEWVP